jgi:hypothetical protein
LTSAINPKSGKSQKLPEIAKICNDKRFVDTDGKNIRENKREAKPFKREAKPLKRSREKKVGKREN